MMKSQIISMAVALQADRESQVTGATRQEEVGIRHFDREPQVR